MAEVILKEENISSIIYNIRGEKVMLDRDLATLYNVETRVFKQTVRRNINRFPADFMFELSAEEFKNWRSQFVTSNLDEMGLRYASRTFTEQKNIYCKNISILVIASFSAKQSMGLMQLSLKFISRKQIGRASCRERV